MFSMGSVYNLTPLPLTHTHTQIMSMLQQVTPEIVRPYTVRNTHTATGGQMITSLSFKGNDLLITGSHDTQVTKTLNKS